MSSFEEMNKVLNEQKDFFIKNGSPSVELRIDRLQRLKSLIMDNRYDFVDCRWICRLRRSCFTLVFNKFSGNCF